MSPLDLRHLPLLPLCLSLLAAPALAQDDEVIPYPDDPVETDIPRRRLPPISDPTRGRAEETEIEKQDRLVSLAGLDDPTLGLGAEAVVGVMFLESSRGALVDPRLALGLRIHWEFGRLFFDEVIRQGLFADLSWNYAAVHDGTLTVNTDTHYHYLTIAPGFAFPVFGPDFLLYGQVGGGLVLQYSALHFEERATAMTGLKPALQYGIGFRGRPLVSVDGLLRVSFRVELTRYRRHYMDDTYLGASLGAAF